ARLAVLTSVIGMAAFMLAGAARVFMAILPFPQCDVQPPSTGSAMPVIDAAASEARKTVNAPSSSTVANFLVGCCASSSGCVGQDRASSCAYVEMPFRSQVHTRPLWRRLTLAISAAERPGLSLKSRIGRGTGVTETRHGNASDPLLSGGR